EVEPEIQLGVSAFIPEDYVADVNQRLALYKRLARAASSEELEELRDEMEDRYGPVPARVVTLLQVMELRRHLKAARVVRLRRQGGRLLLRFHEQSEVDAERLVALARSGARRGVRVLPEHEITFPVNRIDLEGMSEDVLGILAEVLPPAAPAIAG
ncbi:MAG: TRCF domain-containing protein, partial [Candidatus Binatia bacterium]